MSLTLNEVLRILQPIEPDYTKIAELGASAMPHLLALAGSDDARLAGRAAWSAAMIGGADVLPVLEVAARHASSSVRAAAAAAAGRLTRQRPHRLILALLRDGDEGVRHVALRSVPPSPPDELIAQLATTYQQSHGAAARRVVGETLSRVVLTLRDDIALQVVYDPPGSDIAGERVTVAYTGDGELDVGGFTLRDAAGHTYTFPTHRLRRGDPVAVWTGAGRDDVRNLYWNRKQAVWNNRGDLALLSDKEGRLVQFHHYV